MEVDPSQNFFAVAHLCKIDWDCFGSHNCFFYKYKTGKLSRFNGLVLEIHELHDSIEKNIDGTEPFPLNFSAMSLLCAGCRSSLQNVLNNSIRTKKKNCFGITVSKDQEAL